MDLPAKPGAPAGVEREFTLENGLRVFLYERHSLPLVNIVAAVSAGSKDETEATSGLAHLLEHYTLFRGTEIRSGTAIARDVRRHGAYFNARTGQDLALYEISLPSEFADFGLANQKEILFDLKIDPKEVDAEKEVVLEELSQMQDDPFRYASALLYQNLYPGHPYGRPVYGKAETIKALTADQLEAFYRAHYVPANVALAVVGDFVSQDMEAKVRTCFGSIPKTDYVPAEFERPARLPKTVEIVQELDVKEAYLAIGTAAPDYNSPDQYAADLLTEILGRGISPLLYRPLKGNRDLINTASMSYISMKYAGAFAVTLTLDPKRLTSAKSQALQFLRQVRNENFSKDDVYGEAQIYAYDFLAGARNQILFKSQQGQESGLAVASSLAMYLQLRESGAMPNYLDNIRKIKSSDLRAAAAKYLGKAEYVVVAIVPKKAK